MRLSLRSGISAALLLGGIVGCDESPTEPPDGRRNVLFTTGADDEREVWVMAENGTLARRLTSNTVIDANPRWSNEGAIVVARARTVSAPPTPDPVFDLYIIEGSDLNSRRLTTSPTSDSLPTFSPHGQTIAFIARQEASAGYARVHLIDADGDNRRAISPEGLQALTSAEWSADGQELLFGARRTAEGPMELIVMDVDGENPLTIPDPCAADFELGRWNGFTGQISLTCYSGAERPMYVMSSDGGDQRRITPPRPEQSTFGDFGGIWGAFTDDVVVMRVRDGIVIGVYTVNVNSLGSQRWDVNPSATFRLADWFTTFPID